MRLYSNRESVDRGEVSLLAIVETLAAVGVSLWIAWRFGTVKHIAVGACLAPLLLLRTARSTEWGLSAFKKAAVWYRDRVRLIIDRIPERGIVMIAKLLLVTPLLMGLGLVALLVRLSVTAGAAVRHPVQTLRAIPDNWRRTTIASDSLLVPEIVPGVEDVTTKGNILDELRFSEWIRALREAIDPQRGPFDDPWWLNYLVAGVVTLAAVAFYLPAILYRWSLKSTSLIYAPLLWVVRATFADEGNTPGRLKFLGRSAIARITALYSTTVLTLFLVKCYLYGTWERFPQWWEETRFRQLLAAYVEPRAIPPWQFASGINAALALGLFLYAWYLLQRRDADLPVDESIADVVMKSGFLVRSLLTVYVLACTVYITVNAARGWPWPRLGPNLFPWGG